MTTISKTPIRRMIVALNFPSMIAAFIVFAKAIFKTMSDNANFTVSAAKLTTLNTDITALDAAETACNTKPPSGTVETRNVLLEAVKNDLRALRSDVQLVADANPAKAEAIIISAAMDIKQHNHHGKQVNTASDGTEEGSADLTAEGNGPHEWRMGTDENKWTYLPSTATSKTSVSGLTPGTIYFFQNRRILRNGDKAEWSQSIKIRVR